MNNEEQFWHNQQTEASKNMQTELEKSKNLSLDLWKTIIATHLTILGMSLSLAAYMGNQTNKFLVATWISQILSISLGLLSVKIFNDDSFGGMLAKFQFDYNMNEINIRHANNKFSSQEERKGLVIAMFINSFPDTSHFTKYAIDLAEKYKDKLPSDSLFKKTYTPVISNEHSFLKRHLHRQWPNMTLPAISLPEDQKEAKKAVRKRLSINLTKQSRLTDAYIENLMSKGVFETKNKDLMKEGKELKKLAALCELRGMDRKNSLDYAKRVREFLINGNPYKMGLTPAEKKTTVRTRVEERQNIRQKTPCPRIFNTIQSFIS